MGSQTRAAQPEPMMLPAAAVICLRNFSKPPKSSSIAAASGPSGRPPAFGERFFQNSEWRTWPERLKARARSRAGRLSKLSLSRASPRRSRAVLAPFTYAAWCLSWWSSMIRAETWGSRAE